MSAAAKFSHTPLTLKMIAAKCKKRYGNMLAIPLPLMLS